jgi:hypothetical protein
MNLTGTYSDAYGYSHGVMLARNVIKDFRAFLRSIGRLSEPACIGVERHPTTDRDILHFHALVGGVWTDAQTQYAAEEWKRTRGWSVAKTVTNRVGCVEYSAKHLLKQRAEDHFEFWLAPPVYSNGLEARLAREARHRGAAGHESGGQASRVVRPHSKRPERVGCPRDGR